MATFEERVLAYLDGSLSDSEREDLLRTVSTSPDKRRLLDAHIRLRDILAASHKPVAAPLLVQRQLAAQLPMLAAKLPGLAASGSSVAIAGTATKGIAGWFGAHSSAVLRTVIVGGILLLGGAYYTIRESSHNNYPTGTESYTQSQALPSLSQPSKQSAAGALSPDVQTAPDRVVNGSAAITGSDAPAHRNATRLRARTTTDHALQDQSNVSDVTSGQLRHGIASTSDGTPRTAQLMSSKDAGLHQHPLITRSAALPSRLHAGSLVSKGASSDQASSVAVGTSRGSDSHDVGAERPSVQNTDGFADLANVSEVTLKEVGPLATLNTSITSRPILLQSEERNNNGGKLPIQIEAFVGPRVLLIPAWTPSAQVQSRAISGRTLSSLDVGIGMRYEFSPAFSIGLRATETKIARIESMQYSEPLAVYGYLWHKVNDAAIVSANGTLVELSTGYTVLANDALSFTGSLLAGVVVASSVSPAGSVGSLEFTAHYDLGGTRIQAGVNVNVLHAAPVQNAGPTPQAPLGSGGLPQGEVTRGLAVTPLTTAGIGINLGVGIPLP